MLAHYIVPQFMFMLFMDMVLAIGTFIQVLNKAPAISVGTNQVTLAKWQHDFALVQAVWALVVYVTSPPSLPSPSSLDSRS